MTYPAVEGWASHDMHDSVTGTFVRDVSGLMLEVLRRDPVLLGRFKTGKAATNRKTEWFEREWVPYQFTTDTNLQGDGTTDETLTAIEHVPSGDTGSGGRHVAGYFQPGDLFMMVGSTDGTVGPGPEVYQVVTSTESTNVIVLDRTYGGSTSNYAWNGNSAITTNGLIFEKIGPVTEENSSPGNDKSRTYGPALYNYTQIFSYDLDVSGSMLAMNLYNMNDFFGTQLRELTEELKLQLERTVIYGLAHSTVPLGDDTVARTMNGIRSYLTATGGNSITSGYTVPNEDLINALCRKIIAKNAQLDNRRGILACSPANAEIIADIWKDKITISREDTTRGTQVKSIVTKLGFTLDIVWDPNIHNNDLFILNPSKIEIAPLQGRAWFVKRYDNGKDGQTARVLGEWTCRIFDAKADHAICTCLTTT